MIISGTVVTVNIEQGRQLLLEEYFTTIKTGTYLKKKWFDSECDSIAVVFMQCIFP